MHASKLTFAILTLLLAACTESTPLPTSADIASPVFAKPAVQSPVSASFNIPSAGYSLASSDGDTYADGVCGVLARVFYLAPDYLDGNLQLDNPRAKDRSCGTSPRNLTITYPDNGLVQTNSGGMNIGLMGTVTVSSGPQERSMNIGIAGSGARCTRLGFGNLLGGTKVVVTRVSATQWNVASQMGGSTAACLTPSGQTELIPNFQLNITVSLN